VLRPASAGRWLAELEESGWLEHIRLLLSAAERLTVAVARRRMSCLVHCSDGWDR
jgi:myotubularin-related protein 1/2